MLFLVPRLKPWVSLPTTSPRWTAKRSSISAKKCTTACRRPAPSDSSRQDDRGVGAWRTRAAAGQDSRSGEAAHGADADRAGSAFLRTGRAGRCARQRHGRYPHLHGRTGLYPSRPRASRASTTCWKMAAKDCGDELTVALHKAVATRDTVYHPGSACQDQRRFLPWST